MARDPHEGVDFAPAWLNFSNNSKKKSEKPVHGLLHNPAPLLKAPQKSSQEPTVRSAVGGGRVTGSPSRSLSSSGRWNQSLSNPRTGGLHRSADFTLGEDSFPTSPGREQSMWGRSGTNKGEFGSHPMQGKLTPLKRMDVDFPSLCENEAIEGNKSKPTAPLGPSTNPLNMWEKPLILKSPETECRKSESLTSATTSHVTSNIYKNLVPKPALHKKQPYRRTMSVPLTTTPKGGNSIVELITRGSKREHSAMGRQIQAPLSKTTPENITNNVNNHVKQGRVGQRDSAGQALPVDIGVIGGYKKHRKGKSHFLKELRQSEGVDDYPDSVSPRGDCSHDECENSPGDSPDCADPFEEDMEISRETTGNDASGPFADESHSPLSSSLEAEHRLLRQMGWRCDDELTIEDQPLTEDEIQDFFQQNKDNGLLSVQTSGHRQRALRNALSCWKYSGRKTNGTALDLFSKPQEISTSENGVHSDKDSISSDENF